MEKSMKELHLDAGLQQKIREYFHMRFDMYHVEEVAREAFVGELSEPLRGSVELYLKSEVISEFPVVADLLMDSKYIAMRLCRMIESHLYPIGDTVAHEHSVADR